MSTVEFPPRLQLAVLPTPLEPLDRISSQLGGPRIWIKRDDLTGSASTGNKVRKLEFTFAQAIEAGCDTVITCGGLQSNHCRSTALLGAKLGLKVHLVLRGEPDGIADGNLFLDQLCGAEIDYHTPHQYQTQLPSLLKRVQECYAADGRKAWIIPTGASDGIGVWGYIGAADELKRDFAKHNIAPNYIFHATGSGGTQAGLTVGGQLFQLGVKVVGIAVCDDESYFVSKVREDLQEWQLRYGVDVDLDSLSINVLDAYVGPGYAKATQNVFDSIAWLAREEGIILDPVYSGKAFDGLIQEIRAGHYADEKDIVFVHTGGVFGLMPYRDQFGPAI